MCRGFSTLSPTFIFFLLTASSFCSVSFCSDSSLLGLSNTASASVHQSEVWFLNFWKLHIPSPSAAQGGGGSFKVTKPIGEFGCCESWMAEPTHWWIKRWLECRAIYVSIYLSRCLSICLFVLSIYLSIYWAVFLSIYLSIYLSFYLTL